MTQTNTIENVAQLEDLLSTPTQAAIDAIASLEGDFILLGAGGKMGPSLTRMLCRCCAASGTQRTIYAVSRFSNPALKDQFTQFGATPIPGDLLDREFVASLPDVPNVIYMTGVKFGTGNQAGLTWAMNTYAPALVGERYRGSRMLMFSTGNVYPFVPIDSGGSAETDTLEPVGEYGMSAVGRERMFEYFSHRDHNPLTILRLNYAVEMRYGVLVDIANKVWHQEPIDVSMAHANVIWQGDANAMTLCALADASTPPHVINCAGPEIFAVRDVAQQFGELMQREPNITGTEAPQALLNNGTMGHEKYGPPRVSLNQLIHWIADWIQNDRPLLGKPTHFEVRDGKF